MTKNPESGRVKSVVELSQFFTKNPEVVELLNQWLSYKSIRTNIYIFYSCVTCTRGSGGAAPGNFCDSKSKFAYFLTFSLPQNENFTFETAKWSS